LTAAASEQHRRVGLQLPHHSVASTSGYNHAHPAWAPAPGSDSLPQRLSVCVDAVNDMQSIVGGGGPTDGDMNCVGNDEFPNANGHNICSSASNVTQERPAPDGNVDKPSALEPAPQPNHSCASELSGGIPAEENLHSISAA